MITDRAYKSTQTRCENEYKKLKEEIEPLYKKRNDILPDLQFFCNVREHERIPDLQVQKLNEVRAKLMYDLAMIDLEVKRITDLMIENHRKKVECFLEWQKQQKVINGFQIEK